MNKITVLFPFQKISASASNSSIVSCFLFCLCFSWSNLIEFAIPSLVIDSAVVFVMKKHSLFIMLFLCISGIARSQTDSVYKYHYTFEAGTQEIIDVSTVKQLSNKELEKIKRCIQRNDKKRNRKHGCCDKMGVYYVELEL